MPRLCNFRFVCELFMYTYNASFVFSSFFSIPKAFSVYLPSLSHEFFHIYSCKKSLNFGLLLIMAFFCLLDVALYYLIYSWFSYIQFPFSALFRWFYRFLLYTSLLKQIILFGFLWFPWFQLQSFNRFFSVFTFFSFLSSKFFPHFKSIFLLNIVSTHSFILHLFPSNYTYILYHFYLCGFQ